MKNLMTSYINLMDRVNKLLYYFSGVLLISMSVIIIYQVFSRFVLEASLPWSEELTRYLMIWAVFIGASLALRNGALIGVEAIAEAMPNSIKKAMKISVSLFSMIFFGFLIFIGLDIVEGVSVQTSPAMHIPMSWAYAAIPVGSLFMLLNSITVIFELIMNKEREAAH